MTQFATGTKCYLDKTFVNFLQLLLQRQIIVYLTINIVYLTINICYYNGRLLFEHMCCHFVEALLISHLVEVTVHCQININV